MWDFAEAVPKARRDRLVAVPSFENVIDGVARGTVDDFDIEPRQNPPCLGTFRAFFSIGVHENDYDAFFNSPVGYRAQYCIDSAHGNSANRRLIDALFPACLSYARGREPDHFPSDLVAASLQGADAKIWIKEEDLPEVDEIHIDYAPWVAKARAAASGTIADQASRASAVSGVLAPVGTYLELKGAWVNLKGEECRDPKKAGRAAEIQVYGFT